MSMQLTGPGKIICLSGSPRDQGRAHGLECRQEISENLAIIRRGMSRLASRGKQYDFDTLIAANERFVEHTAPEVLDEIQGIAESSGIAYRDLLLINLPLYFVAAFLPRECSQVLLMPPATRDGKTYLAKTRDIGGGKLRNVVLHRRYPDGRELVEVNVAGSITWLGSGMNSDGVVLSTSGVWSKRTTVDLERIGRGWLLVNGHLLLRDSHSLDDLVARANAQPRVTGINMVAADTHSGAALEWTADCIYRQDAEEGIVVRTNHYLTSEIQHLGPTPDENPSSHHRREVALARIKSKYGSFDLDTLATLLADHDGYPNLSLCRHSEGGVGSDTIYASIAVLPDGKFWSVMDNPCTALRASSS